MIATQEVAFGEWLPEHPGYLNPGCQTADGVMPTPGGYRPFLAPVQTGQSFTGTCKGSAKFHRDSQNVIVGGTEDSLFVRIGATTDEDTGYNAVPDAESWGFAQFGSWLFATSSTNAPQYINDFTSSTAWTAAPGSPPTAQHCARVGEFLVLGNLSTGVNEIAWSAFNNPTGSWAVDRLTQAGAADLPYEGGAVQAIVGGRYGLIFQERSISRLEYVGPPITWNRPEISSGRGCLAPRSVVPVGSNVFFLGQDGFYLTDGSSIEGIGNSKVNRWFFDQVDQSKVARVQGAVDWQNKCVLWNFHSGDTTGYNRQIVYSWSEARWSSAAIETQWIVGGQQDATTLEDLDALFPSGLETVDPPLDSAYWKAGQDVLSAWVADGSETTYAQFSGEPVAAEFLTGLLQPDPGKRVEITEIHPVFEASDWQMTAAVGAATNERAIMIGGYTSPGVAGFCPARASGRLARVSCVVPAGTAWTKAQGLQIRYRTGGNR